MDGRERQDKKRREEKGREGERADKGSKSDKWHRNWGKFGERSDRRQQAGKGNLEGRGSDYWAQKAQKMWEHPKPFPIYLPFELDWVTDLLRFPILSTDPLDTVICNNFGNFGEYKL